MKKFRILVSIIAVSFVCLLFLEPNKFQVSGEDDSMKNKTEVSKDPCWFLSSKADSVEISKVLERQEREMYGYPTDIALEKALEVFNQEQKCIYNKDIETAPDLTEDEILSALAFSPDYTNRTVWKNQIEVFRYISTEKKLPKGSLLVREGGGTYNLTPEEEIKVKGQRIYLFMRLDKNPRYEPIEPEQIILIKKTFYGLEIKK